MVVKKKYIEERCYLMRFYYTFLHLFYLFIDGLIFRYASFCFLSFIRGEKKAFYGMIFEMALTFNLKAYSHVEIFTRSENIIVFFGRFLLINI